MSYVRNVVPLLAELFHGSSEHELVVLAFRKHIDEMGVMPKSTTVIEVSKERGGVKRVLWEMYAMQKIVKDNAVDVFYTPYQLAPNVRGVKTVSMIRNMEPFRFTKYRQVFKNYLRNVILKIGSERNLLRSDRVIAVSEYAMRECLDKIGVELGRLKKIYHGRDTRFSPIRNRDDNKLLGELGIDSTYIFTCGSILPYRRVEHIVSAFNVWEGATNNKLVIAGAGNDQRYANLLRRLIDISPAPENILLLGHVSPESMRVLYRNCRLFMTATDIEACPNMGIEALSSGCNILSSNNEPMPEIFQDAAQYYSGEDLSSLTGMLRKAWSAADGVNTKALQRSDDFSWDRCARETFEFLVNWE